MNRRQLPPSLTASVGDVAAQSTVVVQWWLTASLQGQFKDLHVMMIHRSPWGDGVPSLVESVSIYEVRPRPSPLHRGPCHASRVFV